MKYEIYKREEKRKVPKKYRTVRVDVAMINTGSNIALFKQFLVLFSSRDKGISFQ